jgi:hypothetical protein
VGSFRPREARHDHRIRRGWSSFDALRSSVASCLKSVAFEFFGSSVFVFLRSPPVTGKRPFGTSR